MIDFAYSQVLKAIGTAPQNKEVTEKYKLKEVFKSIGDRLNNFVHGNGRSFYNQMASWYTKNELEMELGRIASDAKYMTMVFLFLLILSSPISIMAEDYIDCLDLGIAPPKDSQYWVASFIEEFIRENILSIDSECLQYLREHTMMQL